MKILYEEFDFKPAESFSGTQEEWNEEVEYIITWMCHTLTQNYIASGGFIVSSPLPTWIIKGQRESINLIPYRTPETDTKGYFTFISGRMKVQYEITEECADNLIEFHSSKDGEPVGVIEFRNTKHLKG